jgi:hypothetical protein
MPRIPPSTLDAIKRDVGCRAVLEGRGAVFVKHGPDWACRCPLGGHADETPSLVVSERKNLWRCHGCGQGGDVIRLVQALDGVSFRHAVELLADGVAAVAAGAGAAAGRAPAAGRPAAAGPVKHSTLRRLPCPLSVDADDGALADQVVGYYARRLHEPGNAGLAYLASRGLADAEFLRRFAVGFADRSLGLRLPHKNRADGARLRSRLEALGWFRASGHEHLAGSVVLPIHGPDGRVVSAYGRKITDGLRTGTPKHLYLTGQPRSVWNMGPDLIDGDGTVVVCEALLDAASVWISGRRSVTAAYGVHGWSDAHDAALLAGKARSALIAFDADAAGDAGASALGDRLISQGLSVFRVVWPAGLKDANAVMMDPKHGPEAIREALRTAVWVGGAARVTVPALVESMAESSEVREAPAPGPVADFQPAPTTPQAAACSSSPLVASAPAFPAGVTVSENAGAAVIGIGTRTYRLRGLERARVDALRVNVRVSVSVAGAAGPVDRLHVDTIDLYQARMRHAFASAAAGETGLSVDLLRADLGSVLLAAEILVTQRAAAAAAAAPTGPVEPAGPVMTADEEAAARALLMAPDVLDRIAADLGRCGLVGEAMNKKAAVIACVSRLTDQPLAVLVQSTSAAGKTTLMDAVLDMLPENAVRRYSAISGKSPFYLGSTPLRHRVLAIAEEEGARRASYALKLLQSDGKLSMAATGKDPESGKLVTHDYTVEGPVMLFMTTTAIDLDPELVNRCLVLTVDESPEQTAAIHAAQLAGRTVAGLTARDTRAGIRRLHQHAQSLLKSYPVVLPDGCRFRFAAGSSRLRRDHQKFLNLISAVTLLYQFQRTPKTITTAGGQVVTYLEATAADLALAGEIAAAVLPRTLDDLPPQTRRLWDLLRGWVADEAVKTSVDPSRITLNRRQIQALAGWSYKQVRTHVDRLADHEYLLSTGGGHGQIVGYRVVIGIDDDRPGSPVDLGSGAPAPASAPVGEPTTTVASLPTDCPPFAHGGRAIGNDDGMQESSEPTGPLPGLPGFTYGGHTTRDPSQMHPTPARAAG